MAHSYSHLFALPTTGLRFFTVYGPWGRPDMAYFKFVKKILNGDSIDIIPSANTAWSAEHPDPSSSYAPYWIFNIDNNAPVKRLGFVDIIEDSLGVKANKNMLPMQDGDVPMTYVEVSQLIDYVDFKANTSLEIGIKAFVSWYRQYYG